MLVIRVFGVKGMYAAIRSVLRIQIVLRQMPAGMPALAALVAKYVKTTDVVTRLVLILAELMLVETPALVLQGKFV